MQENKSGIRKIPANFAYMLQQLANQQEKAYYFTFLNRESSLSYVIQISKEKPINMPRSITENLITQQQIILSKESKKNVLSKFVVCSCDELNTLIRNYFILNFEFSGVLGLQINLRAFQFQAASKNLQSKIVSSDKLDTLVHLFQQKTNQIWTNYELKYCRSMSEKKNKEGVQLSHSIHPFLQYQVKCLTSLQLNQKSNIKIIQPQVFNYQFYVMIETNLSNSDSNLKLMIKQKIEQINKKRMESLKILRLERPNLFLNLRGSPSKLFNPHIYSKFAKKQKYELILVKGMYEYYHYGDQNFHDNGWGCAYRALQTLISWLNIQGHTEPMKQMITISQIQQKLDSFDRSRKLKGSNTWIGATQISWIVPKITKNNLNCKILHVSNGKNILEKCEEFKAHFLNSGCPIMYGGGQYAYSIVGMHYNWKLGECQFLILDPHYTGEDDFAKILQKKGLSWRKPQQMFKAGIFYNFCLPLVK